MTKWKSMAWGFLGALGALAIYVIGSAAYVDHQRTATLWQIAVENAQRQQAMAAQQSPQPPSEPTAKPK